MTREPYARAEACLDTCVALWPDFHGAWFNRGLVYLKQHDWERAEKDFDHCLTLRPDTADAYVNRALARQGRKEYAAAVRDVTWAIELGSPETRLYLLRAQLHRQAGDGACARVLSQRKQLADFR